jgi:hypothetical protein
LYCRLVDANYRLLVEISIFERPELLVFKIHENRVSSVKVRSVFGLQFLEISNCGPRDEDKVNIVVFAHDFVLELDHQIYRVVTRSEHCPVDGNLDIQVDILEYFLLQVAEKTATLAFSLLLVFNLDLGDRAALQEVILVHFLVDFERHLAAHARRIEKGSVKIQGLRFREVFHPIVLSDIVQSNEESNELVV